ncbi:MAG: hypothetical protein E7361_03145 [Clostridiales bacterium]|nr:hypothetical protein [Clostridiales bacterium]
MRKKTINHFFDNLMWNLLYLLPIICFIISINTSGQLISFTDCMTSCGFGILTDNIVFVALNSLFGVGGILPVFVSTDLLLYFSYFICIWLCHIAVDVLLFLIRYAHKLMDSFGGVND